MEEQISLRNISKEALAVLGAPELVYIREVAAKDVLGGAQDSDDIEVDPNAILYAVYAADGSRLAVLDNRKAAFAAAWGNELKPVSVH
jgi:hypothetical protein